MKLSWLIHANFFFGGDLTNVDGLLPVLVTCLLFFVVWQNKVMIVRLTWLLACNQGSLVGLCAQDYSKSLTRKTSDLNERNFLVRVIYKDCY